MVAGRTGGDGGCRPLARLAPSTAATATRCAVRRPWPRSAPSATRPGCRPYWPRSDDKPAIRRRAAVALAAFEGPEVEAALRRCLEDRDWQVRQVAEDLLADD